MKTDGHNSPAVAPEFVRFAKELLTGRPIICDIGSRDAQEGIFLLKQLNGRELHIFEPNPLAAQICRGELAKLASEGDPQEIFFNQVAVTDKVGQAPFYPVNAGLSDNKDIGFSSLFRINPDYTRRRGSLVQDEIRVNTTTLDEYFKDREKPALLWMDVEGAELQVLRGANEALTSVKLLHIEVSLRPMQIGKPLFWQIHRHLRSCGFAFYGFTEVSPLRGFLYRWRLLPNLPWRLNAVYYKKSGAKKN